MAKDTFEEIHGNAGGTIQTGPNLGAMVGAAEAACAAQEAGGGAVGGAAPASPVPLPRLSSFCVYYDESDKTLKIFEPQVIGPNGQTVVVGLPGSIANGTYYCNVLKQKTSGTCIAKIETTAANADSGYEKVCSVKLFTLNGMDFRQFHAGAIVVPGGSAGKYVAGDDTNIVFTEKKDSAGNATGEIAVDVYYK